MEVGAFDRGTNAADAGPRLFGAAADAEPGTRFDEGATPIMLDELRMPCGAAPPAATAVFGVANACALSRP